MAGDFDRTLGALVDNDDLLALNPVRADEHPCAGQVRGDGVLAILERHHRSVLRNRAGQPERHRVRGVRDPVQPRLLFDQHHRGLAASSPMLTVVDVIHECLAGRLELRERRVLGQQVRVFRDDVGRGELH